MSGAEIRDLNILLANETPLDVISQYTTADLTNASINELKIIISRINASAYLGGSQPRKYWAYTCSKSGTKTELIDRIVNPNYDSRNKNIRVQELVLEEALQCLETGQHGNWVLRNGVDGKPLSGNEIEHWLFKKSVINTHLSGDKGNPFTVFKIDSRKDACRGMWINDLGIGRTKQDGEKYLFFTRGFFNQFCDFAIERPSIIHLSDDQVRQVSQMDIVKESDAEGFLFSILLHVARREIYSLIGVNHPQEEICIVITAHRRQSETRQFEFDTILAWQNEGVQYRTQCEVKTSTAKEPDWSAGFSRHQMQDAAGKIDSDIISPNRSVQSLYVRCEVNNSKDTWNAKLDLYDGNGNYTCQLDIYDIPN